MRDYCCLPYLDDFLYCSETSSEHVEDLRRVLCQIREQGIKLRPFKCEVFRRQVRYIGWMVGISCKGVQIDPKDLEAVLLLKGKEPLTIGEVRTLLGFLGYYRPVIQDFSRLAKPLFELLQRSQKARGKNAKPKPTRGKTKAK